MTEKSARRAAQAGDLKARASRADGANREVALLAITKSIPSGEGESRAIQNPWENAETNGIVDPPFDLFGLSMLGEQSSELGQCVDAMQVNIPGYGWRLKRHPYAVDPALDELARVEHERFEQFLLYADYDESSFTALRRNTRKDLEYTGNAYWEVVRTDAGDICAFKLLPSYTVRLGPLSPTAETIEEARPVGRGENRRFERVRVRKRFRTFVQCRFNYTSDGEPQRVFFKQFGDPRDILWASGEVVTDAMRTQRERSGHPISPDELATEVVHWRIFSPRSPYGTPRFIGNLLSIFGGRAAEEINFTTFKNNNIPSMAVLVSNGQLTEGTITRITQFVETTIQGSDNYSKMLVIEAEGLGDEDDPSTVKLDIKPLTKEQHTDELFQNYSAKSEERVRRSFRLPPIFLGSSEDYTRSTADTSRKLADEQVFAPERQADDWTINRILASMGMLYHVFETNSPNVTDDEDLIAVLTGAEKAGGTTPRIARTILEDILGRDLGEISPKLDPDVPFSLQMAEAVKNLAQPNEVGQQVTALKREQVEVLKGLVSDTGLEAALDAIISGGSPSGVEDVAINLGAQAFLVAERTMTGALSAEKLNLAGREMLISDGHDALARAAFGVKSSRMGIGDAAKAVGLPEEEVVALFPGKDEVFVHPVDAVERFAVPIPYAHPEGERFAKGVIAASPGLDAATSGDGVLNMTPDQLQTCVARVRRVQASAPHRVRAVSSSDARELGVQSSWEHAARLEEALRTPFAMRSTTMHKAVDAATRRVSRVTREERDLASSEILGLALFGHAHPRLEEVLREAERATGVA